MESVGVKCRVECVEVGGGKIVGRWNDIGTFGKMTFEVDVNVVVADVDTTIVVVGHKRSHFIVFNIADVGTTVADI